MSGKLYKYFTDDHRRLDELLDRATADPDAIDEDFYGQFRAGLLKHIAMEEKALFPAAQRYRGGKPLAIAALLVPPPSRNIVSALRSILAQHDLLEEIPGDAYEVYEQLAGEELDLLIDMIRKTPDVPPNPYNLNPNVLDAIRRSLAGAGYNFDDYRTPE